MDSSVKSEAQVYKNYWGKPRKSAVRTRPNVMKPSISEIGVDFFDGKVKKMEEFVMFEGGSEMGKTFMGCKGEIQNACQVFDERFKKEKTEKNCWNSDKFSKDYTGAIKGIVKSKMGFNKSGVNVVNQKQKLLKTDEKNRLNSGKFSKEYTIAIKGFTKSKMGCKRSGLDVVNERRKLLKLFRKECEFLRQQKGKLCKRIDRIAYDAVKDTGDMFITHKTFGPVSGVEVGESFNYRMELMIMGIHTHPFRGIDYKETFDGRVLATSIVATEGYDDDLMMPNELIYTGEGGTKDQELKGGNLALVNSANYGNFVRVVRGVKASRNDVKFCTIFVYDGLYKVVDYAKVLGSNGMMQFKFMMRRCTGQKPINWEKYR